MVYFSYGSNMLQERLQQRVASARAMGTARLDGYRLAWHKRSKDGSGKCDIVKTDARGDCVWGVVYKMEADEKPLLDAVEGLGYGYDQAEVTVELKGEPVRVFTYIATDVEESLTPYFWYKAFVVEGAKENGLPNPYVRMLEKVSAVRDPDMNRRRMNEEILKRS